MISQVDNILKGRVESSVEYETYKKVIGMFQGHLTPGEDGIVPLSKQNAFTSEVKEEVVALETLDFSSNQDNNSEVMIDNPILEEQSQNIENSMPRMFTSVLKEPEVSDISEVSPVEVTSPSELNGLNITANSEIVAPKVVENEVEENGILDIQMPQMPDNIIGLEPKEIDNNLFEMQDISNQTFNDENVINEVKEININNDINSIVEEKHKKFLDDINNMINNHFNEIKDLYNNKKEENEIKTQIPSMEEIPSLENIDNENYLMNDALTQINNMVIPEQSSGLSL